MRVVGTQNANNLISISTDGKMCSWSLDMLSQPQESLELQQKQSKPVAVTTLRYSLRTYSTFCAVTDFPDFVVALKGLKSNALRHIRFFSISFR